ncbi:MAG: hypothetical protein ACI8UP_004295 [Porticoccaceae bacterium]|jgi:hypothetical protein
MASNDQTIPTSALVLGIAGLIPFIACAALACLPELGSTMLGSSLFPRSAGAMSIDAIQQKAIFALGAYGAIILSFLGGVRWGNLLDSKIQLRQWGPLLLSVLPSLIAWPALLLPTAWMLSVLAAGFVLQYAYDVEGVRQKILPEWFGKLRTILTTGATLSLLAGLLAIALSSSHQASSAANIKRLAVNQCTR